MSYKPEKHCNFSLSWSARKGSQQVVITKNKTWSDPLMLARTVNVILYDTGPSRAPNHDRHLLLRPGHISIPLSP